MFLCYRSGASVQLIGAPGGTRTPDRGLSRTPLYPAELPARRLEGFGLRARHGVATTVPSVPPSVSPERLKRRLPYVITHLPRAILSTSRAPLRATSRTALRRHLNFEIPINAA